ncbi:hypothetical protein [uncultured Aquimarina sp.]|uniref:hypothetical protein n=1 Tax=uncultured Aquimarina sp. TaxID=575652 RepID=UPI00260AB608|nr:hypothetical protein [uncultured Aquimarina sp.]
MKTIHETETRLKDFHFEMLTWKSSLQFIEGEVQFINQLLNSYVFEPNTPNLFERLQEFKTQIKTVQTELENIYLEISKQESELGGMMECDTMSCDIFYSDKHYSLKEKFDLFYKNYQFFKTKVFSYAGGVLKKKKK